MPALGEVAHFRADDCEALVLASLACHFCLRSSTVEWEVTRDGYDPAAHCRCRECGVRWHLYLTVWQALRLELMAAREP